ncbi:MAG: ferric reductase-like transmembrane domain-containing protein [Anaerolineae bacterium]|nr:ferric reductase-like transmembrane domain-containing protein [Anaerolineae bacterium]
MLSIFNIGRQRWITHCVLALLTVAAVFASNIFWPGLTIEHLLADALGYESLILIVFTLLIGPWQLYRDRRRKRNPVNINLRRDTGIWAGFTGVAHVLFGFTVHLGGDIKLYFLQPRAGGGWDPLINLFGVSNYIGLAATLVLLVLLLISNDFFLKKLTGPRWKLLQQSNYILVALAVVHTFGYQFTINRERIMTALVIAMVLLVLTAQFIGLSMVRARRR